MPCCCSRRDTAYAKQPSRLRRARLQPKVVFESGQFANILAMVAGGTGMSVVREMAVERRAARVRLPPFVRQRGVPPVSVTS